MSSNVSAHHVGRVQLSLLAEVHILASVLHAFGSQVKMGFVHHSYCGWYSILRQTGLAFVTYS